MVDTIRYSSCPCWLSPDRTITVTPGCHQSAPVSPAGNISHLRGTIIHYIVRERERERDMYSQSRVSYITNSHCEMMPSIVFQASKKTSLNLHMERMTINERKKPLTMSGLTRQARGSSTGSSLSSLSPDDERPKSISSRFSQQQNQRLNKDNLAKLKNRPTKVIESSSEFKFQLKYLFPRNQLFFSEKCAGCSKPLKEDGFFALGQLYHKNCFRSEDFFKRLLLCPGLQHFILQMQVL